jgi:hypothetical protein
MRKWLVIGVGTMILAWIPYLTSPTASTERTPPDARVEAKDSRPTQPAQSQAVAAEQTAAVREPSTSTSTQIPPAPLEERIASFRRAFDTEPRDAFWANDQEAALSSLMEAEEFTAEDIAEIACRRSVCRILFKDPQPTPNRTFTALARLRGHFGDVHFVPQESTSDPAAQLYLLRQGYALEATAR